MPSAAVMVRALRPADGTRSNSKMFASVYFSGTTELDTVERLEQNGKKWHKCCKLPLARSNAGVCTLYNRIYCVGGWNGQIGIKQCDVYRPLEDKWTSISSLNTGRYQAGVAAFNNKLWAAGGSDAWSCLASVETYDPDTDRWTYAPSLLTLLAWIGRIQREVVCGRRKRRCVLQQFSCFFYYYLV